MRSKQIRDKNELLNIQPRVRAGRYPNRTIMHISMDRDFKSECRKFANEDGTTLSKWVVAIVKRETDRRKYDSHSNP